jgi:tRNA G10  N-methylase Trm11
MTYFLILGNNPALSIAEILNRLNLKKEDVIYVSPQAMVIDFKTEIDVKRIQEILGGTIKIGKIIKEVKLNQAELLINEIAQLISSQLGKIYFGFSFYNLSNNDLITQHKRKYSKLQKEAALGVKNKLKNKGDSSRWVSSDDNLVLSSVIVEQNKLLDNGVEMVFLVTGENDALMGQTMVCQDFKQYSWFDFGRPDRIIEKGMLPPKIAKIMINLAASGGLNKKSALLDPFCGAGTILSQAFLMGYKNIIGTDKNRESVSSSKNNLQWLAEKTKNNLDRIIVFSADVRDLAKKIQPESIDAIITEPYLGPMNFKNNESEAMVKELSQLYLAAFRNFKKILKKNGRVVIIFPIFKINDRFSFLPILEELKKNWTVEEIFPAGWRDENPITKITERGSIIYSREDQRVWREIFIFKKNRN